MKMLAAAAAVALLLAGGAVAAVSATGRSTPHARAARHLRAGRDLRSASAYLGISAVQLESELRSGGSLAQIAQATPGRTVEGLVSALVAAKRARLAKVSSALPRLVEAEVQRVGGPAANAFAPGTGRARLGALADIGVAAASYLGISASELRAQLASGKTLAELAHERGRGEAGLVKALVDARTQALENAVSVGAITSAREAKVLARLQARAERLVNHRFG